MTNAGLPAWAFTAQDVATAPLPTNAVDLIIQRARITCRLTYLSRTGRRQVIPVGPCLVEVLGGRSLDIIWGVRGQRSAALSIEEIQAAQDLGHLVLLD